MHATTVISVVSLTTVLISQCLLKHSCLNHLLTGFKALISQLIFSGLNAISLKFDLTQHHKHSGLSPTVSGKSVANCNLS